MRHAVGAKRRSRRAKWRWWQVLCRIAAVVVLALAGAYVTLPWWAPTGLLRGHLAGGLSRQLGLEATIGQLSLSWSDGVEIRDLTLASPGQSGGETVAEISRIRADFSPIDFLIHRKVSWMELDEVRLLAHVDQDKTVKFLPLEKLSSGPEIKRISVRQGKVTLRFDQQDRELLLEVRNLQYVAGRVQRLGRVTMSAVLEPHGSATPISLNVAAGAGEDSAADARINFTRLDLAELGLPELLNLPLRKLSGRCSGSLDLRINSQLQVDHFSFDLAISKLEVQPNQGPRLPVIDTAHLRIAAVSDLVGPDLMGQQIKIQSASVLLPGIELTGQAQIFTDVRTGQWEAIRSLDVSGRIYPTQLAALLTGGSGLPGELAVAGPVAVTLASKHKGARVELDLTADATAAEIRRTEQIIKPAGRQLQVELAGVLDDRSWDFTTADNSSKLRLGGNGLQVRGTLRNVRRLAERWGKLGRELPLQVALEDLAHVEAEGWLEIRELESLRDVLPGQAAALKDLELRGSVGAWCSSAPGEAGSVHAELKIDVPAETALRFGWDFTTPAEKPTALRLAATIDTVRQSARDIQFELSLGDGRFRVADATLDLGKDDGKPMAFDLGGRFEAKNLQDLRGCFPRLSAAGIVLSGQAQGSCRIQSGHGLDQATVKVDLTGAAVAWQRWLTKPADQQSDVQIAIKRDDKAPEDRKTAVECMWSWPQEKARLTLSASLPEFTIGRMPQAMRVEAAAEIQDATWLVRSCPLLKERLAGGKLGGALMLNASGALQGRVLGLDVHCDAEKLEYVSGGEVRRAKSAGVPLRLDAKCNLTGQADKTVVALQKLAVKLAGNRLDLSGELSLKGKIAFGEKLWPQPALQEFRLTADASCGFDAPLCALLPELARKVQQHTLDGSAQVHAEVRGDREWILLDMQMDASKLSVGPTEISFEVEEGEPPDTFGPLSKPGDMPTRIDVQARAPGDLSRLQIANLCLRADQHELLADGSADLILQANGLPGKVGKTKGHAAFKTAHAETLHQLLPKTKEYDLAGDLSVETEFYDAADGWRIPYVTLRCDELRAKHRGKDLTFHGEAVLRDVRRIKAEVPKTDEWVEIDGIRVKDVRLEQRRIFAIGRFLTDGLKFQLGQNQGWLVADVRDLPFTPAGSVRLLAEYLDDKDLRDWLEPPEEGSLRDRKLSKRVEIALGRNAETLIDFVRPYAPRARLDVQASIDHFRSFDATVDRYYDVRQVALNVSASQGLVEVEYGAGLNGGSIRAKHIVNFQDPNLVVSSESAMQDVIAMENIQPQLAKYFPGNTVYGNFSRTEKVQAPLRELLAGGMDVRYPVRFVGTAETVATDGLVEGRAAPRFVAAIFPGLNLAKYRYSRMTGFATFRPDGVTENDMIFSGHVYDIYIEGTTDANNIGEYTLGPILLGTPQSPRWNRDWRLGRIPILKLRARIEGGKMHDEEVSYPWPNETFGEILIRNNPIYRIWVNLQRNRLKQASAAGAEKIPLTQPVEGSPK